MWELANENLLVFWAQSTDPAGELTEETLEDIADRQPLGIFWEGIRRTATIWAVRQSLASDHGKDMKTRTAIEVTGRRINAAIEQKRMTHASREMMMAAATRSLQPFTTYH